MRNYTKNLGFVLVLVGLASMVLAACVTDQGEYRVALFLAVLAFITGGLVLYVDIKDEVEYRRVDREYWLKKYRDEEKGR